MLTLRKDFAKRCEEAADRVRLLIAKAKECHTRLHTQTVEIEMPEEIGIEIQAIAQRQGIPASKLWQYLCMDAALNAAYGEDKKVAEPAPAPAPAPAPEKPTKAATQTATRKRTTEEAKPSGKGKAKTTTRKRSK